MIVWICTDMEGLAGVDSWESCSDPDGSSPAYRRSCEQLTLEVNAAAAGCFDAGATEVRVLDGHGSNHNKGFLPELLDTRVRKVWISASNPTRWEGLDASVDALAMIGQHAMAGTLHAFADHTQSSKNIIRLRINGQEQGEMGQMALYAGGYGVPLVYVSGDEALCREAEQLFPHTLHTPTKRGTGFATCELYPPDEVRTNIRRDIAAALRSVSASDAWRPDPPIEVSFEWAWSGKADDLAAVPNVRRVDARTVSWNIQRPQDIFTYPNPDWTPPAG